MKLPVNNSCNIAGTGSGDCDSADANGNQTNPAHCLWENAQTVLKIQDKADQLSVMLQDLARSMGRLSTSAYVALRFDEGEGCEIVQATDRLLAALKAMEESSDFVTLGLVRLAGMTRMEWS